MHLFRIEDISVERSWKIVLYLLILLFQVVVDAILLTDKHRCSIKTVEVDQTSPSSWILLCYCTITAVNQLYLI